MCPLQQLVCTTPPVTVHVANPGQPDDELDEEDEPPELEEDAGTQEPIPVV